MKMARILFCPRHQKKHLDCFRIKIRRHGGNVAIKSGQTPNIRRTVVITRILDSRLPFMAYHPVRVFDADFFRQSMKQAACLFWTPNSLQRFRGNGIHRNIRNIGNTFRNKSSRNRLGSFRSDSKKSPSSSTPSLSSTPMPMNWRISSLPQGTLRSSLKQETSR